MKPLSEEDVQWHQDRSEAAREGMLQQIGIYGFGRVGPSELVRTLCAQYKPITDENRRLRAKIQELREVAARL
jgi:hypothetical protein